MNKLGRYFYSFCILLICAGFCIKILLPSLAATKASKPVFKITSNYIGTAQHVAFTPDGKQFLYTEGSDGAAPQIRRWNTESYQELASIKTTQPVLLLSQNGLFYVTSTYIPKENKHTDVRVFRLSDQKQMGNFPNGTPHGKPVQILGDKPLLVIFHQAAIEKNYGSPSKRSFYFWDAQTNKLLNENPRKTMLYGFGASVFPRNAAYSADATKVLSLWPVYSRTRNGAVKQTVENLEPWSKGDEQNPKEAWLLNEVNGKIIKLPFPKKLSGTEFLWEDPALSNDATLYAATSTNNFGGWSNNGEDGTIWCYDLPHQKLLWKHFQINHFPSELLFSPDGTMLAAGGYDNEYRNNGGFLNVIDTKSGKVIHDFTEQTLWGQISDRTKKFAAGILYDNALFQKKFNMSLDEYYRKPPPGNSGLPTSLAWSPDSKTVAASYSDGSVKLWRVKE